MRLCAYIILSLAVISPVSCRLSKDDARKEVASKGDGITNTNTNTYTPSLLQKKSRDMKILRLNNDYSIIPMNPLRFKNLVLSPPREYHAFAFFYSSNKTECPACEESLTHWDHMAKMYYYQYSENEIKGRNGNGGNGNDKRVPVYFVAVDIASAVNRRKVKLDLGISDPTFYYFGKTLSRKVNPMGVYDHNARGYSMEAMVKWIQESCGVKIRLPSKGFAGGLSTLLFSMSILLAYVAYRFELISMDLIWTFVSGINYQYWAVFIAVCLVSGQVYNQIAQTGLAYYGRDGGMVFIAGSSRDQLIGESCLISVLYGIMVYSIIQLIENKEIALKKGDSPETTSAMAYAGIFFMAALLLLMNIVKMKQ